MGREITKNMHWKPDQGKTQKFEINIFYKLRIFFTILEQF